MILKKLNCPLLPAAALMLVTGLGAQTTNPPTRLPEVGVPGEAPITEEMPVGPYGQPEWTTQRRFSTTRVYLQKMPWEAGVEQWWRGRFYRDGTAKHLFQEEIEIGLPHRFQVDLYENWVMDDHRRMRHHDVAAELRWAPADWGKIPLNPAIYGEWKFVDASQGPDVYEIKLLLGEEIAPRWHWGFNAVFEQEVGGERAREIAFSQGVSYTLIDQRLSAGVEMQFKHETERTTRNNPEIKFQIGPSVQWRPTSRWHIDVVPLFGVTQESPRVEAFVIIGFDFSAPKTPGRYAPASLKGQ